MGGRVLSARRARAGALLRALVACVTLGACNLVLGVPDRNLDPNLVCTDGTCTCAPGFADCDGNAANGCEAALATDPANCGACGDDCQNGDCKAGACACHANYASCDGDAANGCEASLQTDPKHCGACGRDCLGGSCSGGTCQGALVDGLKRVNAIQLAGDTLYVAGCDARSPILGVPTAGGPPVPEEAPSKACAVEIAIVGGVAFWTQAIDQCGNADLLMSPLGSAAAPTVLAKNINNTVLAAGPGAVYWNDVNNPNGGFSRMTIPGGATVNIPVDIVTFASDATRLYFADAASGIYSVEHADPSASVTMLSSIPAYRIAADAANVYAADPCSPFIHVVPKAGGKTTALTSIGYAAAIAVDEAYVYWADSNTASLDKVPIGGGKPVEILSGLPFNTDPIAVDQEAVYYLLCNALYKVAK